VKEARANDVSSLADGTMLERPTPQQAHRTNRVAEIAVTDCMGRLENLNKTLITFFIVSPLLLPLASRASQVIWSTRRPHFEEPGLHPSSSRRVKGTTSLVVVTALYCL
jgi:hypothetical protein